MPRSHQSQPRIPAQRWSPYASTTLVPSHRLPPLHLPPPASHRVGHVTASWAYLGNGGILCWRHRWLSHSSGSGQGLENGASSLPNPKLRVRPLCLCPPQMIRQCWISRHGPSSSSRHLCTSVVYCCTALTSVQVYVTMWVCSQPRGSTSTSQSCSGWPALVVVLLLLYIW